MDSLFTVLEWIGGLLITAALAMIALSQSEREAFRIMLAAGSGLVAVRWLMWAFITNSNWMIRGLIGALIGGCIFAVLPAAWQWSKAGGEVAGQAPAASASGAKAPPTQSAPEFQQNNYGGTNYQGNFYVTPGGNRTISDSAAKTISSELEQAGKFPIFVRFSSGENEVENFSRQVIAILKNADWQVHDNGEIGMGPHRGLFGLLIGVQDINALPPQAKIIERVFNSNGVHIKPFNDPVLKGYPNDSIVVIGGRE